ncbi:MAG: hypothetical protein L0Y66_22950 [Myxococcaceae bacterium]|nr:hypothetical protein [Myxococcaceae bacterium]MCI0672940.1 hypothetical protein [Myxococcaceae bacterium]
MKALTALPPLVLLAFTLPIALAQESAAPPLTEGVEGPEGAPVAEPEAWQGQQPGPEIREEEEVAEVPPPGFVQEGVGDAGEEAQEELSQEVQALQQLDARLQQLESLNREMTGSNQVQSEALTSIAELQAEQMERNLANEQSRLYRIGQLAEARAGILTALNAIGTLGALDVEGPLDDAVEALERAADEARSAGLEVEALRVEQAGAIVELAADAADRRDLFEAQRQAVYALDQIQIAYSAIRGGAAAGEGDSFP